MGKIVEIWPVEYHGPLAEALTSFLGEKRALGCRYNVQAVSLARFDRFSSAFGAGKNVLSKELVEAWCAKKTNENARNQQDRVWLTGQLAKFMVRQGWQAYVPPKSLSAKYDCSFVPHIFSEAELKALFESADAQPYCGWSRNKDKMVPLIFRLIYGCGLRASETVALRLQDVDLHEGVLAILDSKNGKDRLVPMSQTLAGRCAEYSSRVHSSSKAEDFFFPAPYTGPYRADSIYKIFRSVLWRAGISHGGRGNGPRLHDLRHTFAVHCLKCWAENGEDMNVCLPILSAYMGHVGLNETQKYLRMTADVFPHITSTLESHFGDVIPATGGGQA